MERIHLTNKERKLLLNMLNSKGRMRDISSDCYRDLHMLEQKGFVKNWNGDSGSVIISDMTDKARLYIASNPKLRNPTLWNKTEFLITTIIAVLALIVSIIGLFK